MNQTLIDHHAVMSLRPNYKALLLTLVNPKYRNVSKALKAMGISAEYAADKQPRKKAKYHQGDFDTSPSGGQKVIPGQRLARYMEQPQERFIRLTSDSNARGCSRPCSRGEGQT